ncbi:hypothetical protein TNCV_1465801 [Trichonephila clavipes]|nr:hypothetical protein TNCV_1465801 [Trichonephila clavipes]
MWSSAVDVVLVIPCDPIFLTFISIFRFSSCILQNVSLSFAPEFFTIFGESSPRFPLPIALEFQRSCLVPHLYSVQSWKLCPSGNFIKSLDWSGFSIAAGNKLVPILMRRQWIAFWTKLGSENYESVQSVRFPRYSQLLKVVLMVMFSFSQYSRNSFEVNAAPLSVMIR